MEVCSAQKLHNNPMKLDIFLHIFHYKTGILILCILEKLYLFAVVPFGGEPVSRATKNMKVRCWCLTHLITNELVTLPLTMVQNK